MIDGVDGLAGGVGLISACSIAIVAFGHRDASMGLLLAAFCGSLLGFLRYNWHPARLFMGDTGSMFIGYIFAVSGLLLNARIASVVSILVPLLAFGIPVIDISLAVWRRVVGAPAPTSDALDAAPAPQERPGFLKRLARLLARLGTADKKHLHHRLLRYYGNNQRKTVWSIYGMGAFMGAAGIACCYLPQKNLILSIAIVIGVFSYIVNRLAVIELWDSTEAIYVDFQSGRCGILLSHAVLPALDLVAVYLAYWLTGDDGVPIVGYLQHVAVVMFCLAFLSRNYKVFWNFAASDDYYRLILSIAGAFLVSRLSDFALPQPQQGVRHFPAACAAIAFTLAARLLLHYCRNALVDRHGSSRLGGDTAPIRTVIIGVTPLTRLYRNSILSNLGNGSRELLIGIIALDRTYFHSYCFGMGVLGGLDDLEHILEKHPFNKAVIAVPPSHDDFDRLQAFCQSHGVELHMLLLTNETV